MQPPRSNNIVCPKTPAKRPCGQANIDELIELVTRLEDFVGRADSVLAALEAALDIEDMGETDTETEEDSSESDEQ